DGGHGELTVDGAGTKVTGTHFFIGAGGAGVVNVTGGASLDLTSLLSVGQLIRSDDGLNFTAGTGVLNVSGVGTTVNSSTLNVGGGGVSGTLVV
ncbi:hypothetical protein, partial [Brucella anthropi]|uniref:hypothetical protein n=1 Tax=Brucella anthropi TaxID=529 RepID=UPI0023610369